MVSKPKFEIGDIFVPKKKTETGYRRRITGIRFSSGRLSIPGFFIYSYEYSFFNQKEIADAEEWEKSGNEINEESLMLFYTKVD